MSHAVIAFGRMNPPTTGHEKMIHAVHKEAKRVGGHAEVIASHSQDKKKNPVPQDKKMDYLKKVAPKGVKVTAASKEHPTVFHHAARLHAAGHEHLTVMSDKSESWGKALKANNGKKGPHGHYNFKSITMKSSGKRDPKASGTEGISGTKMRAHAKSGDHKSFKAGLPKALHPHADEIMKHINEEIGFQASKSQQRLDREERVRKEASRQKKLAASEKKQVKSRPKIDDKTAKLKAAREARDKEKNPFDRDSNKTSKDTTAAERKAGAGLHHEINRVKKETGKDHVVLHHNGKEHHITHIEPVKGIPKADFKLHDKHGNHVYLSHKDEGGGRSVSGTEKHLRNHPAISPFHKKAHELAKKNGGHLPHSSVHANLDNDKHQDVIKKAVFGHDHGSEQHGINNVHSIVRGKMSLKKNTTGGHSLHASEMHHHDEHIKEPMVVYAHNKTENGKKGIRVHVAFKSQYKGKHHIDTVKHINEELEERVNFKPSPFQQRAFSRKDPREQPKTKRKKMQDKLHGAALDRKLGIMKRPSRNDEAANPEMVQKSTVIKVRNLTKSKAPVSRITQGVDQLAKGEIVRQPMVRNAVLGIAKNVQNIMQDPVQANRFVQMVRKNQKAKPVKPKVEEAMEIDEAMDIKQRIKRKLIMRRNRPKLKRMKKLYSKRRVPEKNIRQRARKAAIRRVRVKTTGARGASYRTLSPAAKQFIDKTVKKRQGMVDKIARRLLPKHRKAEIQRLSNSFDQFVGAQLNEEASPKRKDGKAFAIKDTGTVAGNTKHKYKEKTSKKINAAPVTEQDLAALFQKSEVSGFPFEVILEVFIRGIESKHLEEQTVIQNGFARVNSFINQGKAFEEDYDLVEGEYKKPEVQALKRKQKRKSDDFRSKQSVSSKTTAMFKKRHGGKTSQLRPGTKRTMGRSSSAKSDASVTMRPVGGVTKAHRDLGKYTEHDFRRIHGISKSAMRTKLRREEFDMFAETQEKVQDDSQNLTPNYSKVMADLDSVKQKPKKTKAPVTEKYKSGPAPTIGQKKAMDKAIDHLVKNPKEVPKSARSTLRGVPTQKKVEENAMDDAHAQIYPKKQAIKWKVKPPAGTKNIHPDSPYLKKKKKVDEKYSGPIITSINRPSVEKAAADSLKGKDKIYNQPTKAVPKRKNELMSATEKRMRRQGYTKEESFTSLKQWLEGYGSSYGNVRAGNPGGKSSTTYQGSKDYTKVKADPKKKSDRFSRAKTAVSWTKEDIGEENLDELSRETLGSYQSKASDARGHRKLSTKKVDNRYTGVARAADKLDKKKVEEAAPLPTKKQSDTMAKIKQRIVTKKIKQAVKQEAVVQNTDNKAPHMENVPVEYDTNIIAAAANKGTKKKTNKEYVLKIGEKKDVPSNPYMKLEGTPEAAAHARKVTPGQVNEVTVDLEHPSGKKKTTLGKLVQHNKNQGWEVSKKQSSKEGQQFADIYHGNQKENYTMNSGGGATTSPAPSQKVKVFNMPKVKTNTKMKSKNGEEEKKIDD